MRSFKCVPLGVIIKSTVDDRHCLGGEWNRERWQSTGWSPRVPDAATADADLGSAWSPGPQPLSWKRRHRATLWRQCQGRVLITGAAAVSCGTHACGTHCTSSWQKRVCRSQHCRAGTEPRAINSLSLRCAQAPGRGYRVPTVGNWVTCSSSGLQSLPPTVREILQGTYFHTIIREQYSSYLRPWTSWGEVLPRVNSEPGQGDWWFVLETDVSS